MYLCEIILPIPISQKFHYLSENYITPGTRVIVSFGKQRIIGIIYSSEPVNSENLSPHLEYKEIEEVLDPFPLYPESLFPFLEWVANYYLCPVGIVLKIALPAGTFKVPTQKITLTPEGKKAIRRGLLLPSLEELSQKKVSLRNFLKKSKLKLKKIKEWEKKGWIKIIKEIPTLKIPYEVFYRIKKDLPKDLQDEISYLFADYQEIPAETLKKHLSTKVIKKLLDSGYLEKIELPKIKKILLPYEFPEKYELTLSQRNVFENIKSSLYKKEFSPLLLHGVTGSGKSLIYLEAIKEALSLNKRVLFLLPEIALTHYMERILFQFFREEIAILHSTLIPEQRFSEWIKILEGRAKIVVGTRSAIFAPLENIGLIIIDEEHDPSYKEENLPCKYNARDLALVRGKMDKATVLLGSATPSIKSYYFAKIGKYKLLQLTERPFVSMPETKLVVMQSASLLSQEVIKEIETLLSKEKSVFLYLNRRGYAPIVQCSDCKHILQCPNCGIPLTYHKDEEAILCHYCAFRITVKILCPYCRGGQWKFLRYGTERIEEELKMLFPGIEVIRLDRDVITSEKKLKELFEKIYNPMPKIIIGTQMGVHGHNFPQVNLVIVLRAEEGLFLPHFKANERTFQLLLQALGRAGRKEEKGIVILQTSIPEHPVIKYALHQDFEGFFKEELHKRKIYGFPPFKKLAVFYFKGIDEEKISKVALKLKENLELVKREQNLKVEILGPSPCPMRKLRGLYRWQIILKGDSYEDLKKTLLAAQEIKSPGIKVDLDIDPESLL
ncbi:MAG: primosomal protein N' [Caldimicrobium sp.]